MSYTGPKEVWHPKFQDRLPTEDNIVDVTGAAKLQFSYAITTRDRAQQKQQVPHVVWLTGLPSAGKSTIANACDVRLTGMGFHCVVLDGDDLRQGLTGDLGFSEEDRAENVRRVGEVARLCFAAGLIVFVALVSPFRDDRDRVRGLFDAGSFSEVFVTTPLDTCVDRDTKGLYARAAAHRVVDMTGVGQRYETPLDAAIEVDGAGDLKTVADQLVQYLLERVGEQRGSNGS